MLGTECLAVADWNKKTLFISGYLDAMAERGGMENRFQLSFSGSTKSIISGITRSQFT
jgi:hypothetical protein